MGAKTDLKLWTGILAGPAAWVTQLALVYPIAQLTCHAGFAPQHPGTIHTISACAMAVAVLGAIPVWPLRYGSPDQRVAFMAKLAVLTCAIFALIVIATWVPAFVIHNCEA